MATGDPKIIVYCCEQSGVQSADMAGAAKLTLPDNIELVSVPCSGRIETLFLLKAFENGADGVIIFACYEENCQYLQGNLRLRGRVAYAKKILASIGLEEERIELVHLATNSGVRFAETLIRKADALRRTGKNAA